MDEPKTGALFVDFENVFYGLVGEPLGLARDAALSATMDALTKLRRQLREQSYALVLERSYADWEKMPESAQRQLQLSGVLPRFVDARVDKNTADIELSLDLLQFILTRKELKHVVLIGGDRDYLPILRRVKEEQRHVVVCALKASLSGDVREFVNNYVGASIIELDSLIDLGQYRRTARPAAPTAASSPRPVASNGHTGPGPGPGVPPIVSPPSSPPAQPVPPKVSQPSMVFDPTKDWRLHEEYLRAMMRFMRERRYREIHLGPYFRWLTTEQVFPTESTVRLRNVFDELQKLGAVQLEERETGQGYAFSVVGLNYNHTLVQRAHDE